MSSALIELSNEERMQCVHSVLTTAFDQACFGWQRGDTVQRQLWIGIQCACALELQDCVAAAKAGVP